MIPRMRMVVNRISPGSYDKGRWVEGARRDFTFYSTVQPSDGRDLEVLDEARRNIDSYVLITDFHFRTVEVKDKTNPDRVTLFGESYEVVFVKRWTNGVKSNYWVLVQKAPQ
jgi:hypothetical protein